MTKVPNSEKQASEFPVTGRNKAKRLRDRATYDVETVYKLLDSALICHIAYVIDGQPYCTPTLFWRNGDEVVWHGSVGSKMLMAQAKQIDVCLTVSFLDSLVLTRSAFHHSVNYRSVMLFGRATMIDDPEEKKRASAELIDNFLPGRNERVITPKPAEMKQAMFLKMKIDQAVAKIRTSASAYEDPEYKDHPVWAGEIPIELRIGRAIPAPNLDPGIEEGPDVRAYPEGARFDTILLDVRRRAGRSSR